MPRVIRVEHDTAVLELSMAELGLIRIPSGKTSAAKLQASAKLSPVWLAATTTFSE
jgi:hypothetical protein